MLLTEIFSQNFNDSLSIPGVNNESDITIVPLIINQCLRQINRAQYNFKIKGDIVFFNSLASFSKKNRFTFFVNLLQNKTNCIQPAPSTIIVYIPLKP